EAAPPVRRIALIAPFEGAYREIGYDALYPIRLALADAGLSDVVLVSVDAGSVDDAVTRATAIASDPTVLLALVAGPVPAEPRVLAAFADLPIIVIGDWNAAPHDRVLVMA